MATSTCCLQAKRRAAAREESGAAGIATLGGAKISDSEATDNGSEDARPPNAAKLAPTEPLQTRPEAAHAGMVPARRQTVAPTLAEREALALSLLSGS